MRPDRFQPRGFTLLELIMVMVIVAIIAAVVAPSLRGFTIGRKTSDAASQIVGLAMYARAQSISEGRTYRLNFDETKGEWWLTVQSGGAFQSASNEYGTRYQAPTGVRVSVSGSSQFNTQMLLPADTQQVQVQGNALVDQPGLQTNQLMQNVHEQGTTYIEFQPSGRSDPADIKLTDSLNKSVEIACRSATEMFHVVKPGELQ